MSVVISNLEEFNVQLNDLKNINKKVQVIVYLEGPSVKSYISLSRSERKKKFQNYLQENFESISKTYSFSTIEFFVSEDKIEATLDSSELFKLAINGKNIRRIEIQKIFGLKSPKKSSKDSQSEWFVVKGLFVFQTKGQTKGKQTFQEELCVVYAQTLKKAIQQCETEWKKGSEPYFGHNMDIVRKKFIKVTDAHSVYFSDDFTKGQIHFLSSEFSDRKIQSDTLWK
jgi:hypothetical protein